LRSTILFSRLFSRFRHDRKANVAVLFALVMVPTIYLMGMTLDYTQAVHKQSQLNAAADAAVIAAVTPSMLAQSTAAATTAATNVFNATANGLPGLSGPPALNVSVVNNGLVRTATVSYTAAATNNFPILLNTPAWPITGTSTASSSSSPNINFYLLLDDSPSMAIGAGPSDIATLMAATAATHMPNQDAPTGGCGFACHETNPSMDSLGNPGGIDNYQLARNLGITLRIDLVAQAVSSMMTSAQTTATANNTIYQAAIYTFDYGLNTIYAPSGLPTSNLSAAATQAAQNIQLMKVYANDYLTPTNQNSDTDTNFSNAFQSLNTIMPNPGAGTNNTGDTPQEVVFIVTDGVENKIVSSPSACSQATYTMSATQYRCQQPFDTTWCTTVKNRGIRIAVLYTEYLQLTGDGWYNSWIAAFNTPTSSTSQIATNLQSCASAGLFYDVQSGGDVTAALNNLFTRVITSVAAHLTQ
jgi:Flp pilus assembly protein TadG